MIRAPATLACVFVLLAANANPATRNVLEARVIAVGDGDSITVRDSNRIEHRVRLAAVDAPEYRQPFGNRSRQNLARLVLNQDVRLEWERRDGYGRFVADVWVTSPDTTCTAVPCPRTLNVGLEQITAGLAWHFKRFEREQCVENRHRYAFAEVEARARKVGLWSDPDAVPPWDWRDGLVDGTVKKSRAGICHVPGSPAYRSVKHFSAYPTLEACLASGGRLPKSSGS